jgi:hypothetical protein
MDTLLTEIISFSGTAKGIPACEAGPQLHLYFSMLHMQNRSAERHGHQGSAPVAAPLGAEVGFAADVRLACFAIPTADLRG